MVAEDRLEKARCCLDKLHSLILKDKNRQLENSNEIRYELEDFLTAIRSVPDHLLEDYNKKYAVGISLHDELHLKNFKREAKRHGNTDAMNFAQWYEKRFATFYREHVCSFLKDKRDVSTHRQEITPVATREISFSVDVLIGKPEDFKNLEEPKSLEVHTTKPITVGWFFTDYREQDLLSMCEDYYDAMKQFVEEARKMFPLRVL